MGTGLVQPAPLDPTNLVECPFRALHALSARRFNVATPNPGTPTTIRTTVTARYSATSVKLSTQVPRNRRRQPSQRPGKTGQLVMANAGQYLKLYCHALRSQLLNERCRGRQRK